MTLTRLDKFPAPYYGGKTHAAPIIWAALGDVAHYVEPFCGSCANLLLRPHPCNRPYDSETVNDSDGLLINALRSIAFSPDATAEYASWYVSEADLTARHLWLVQWAEDRKAEYMSANLKWHDPEAAGYWLWGLSCWIGGGWCSGEGPWIVGADGRLTKQRRRPHLSDNGQGVTHPGTREPGVSQQLPHLSNDGQGVNHAGTREPGVARGTPDRPWEIDDFHPMTMPELRRWFAFLSARLRHVRMLHGDWTRAVTDGASKTLSVRVGDDVAGIFLDPPYAGAVRAMGLYANDSATISADVRAWCLAHGDDPKLRIVLAGFSGEGHEELEAHGWRVVEWFESGYLRGGMAQRNANGHQQHRERLWLSPQCRSIDPKPAMRGLFDEEDV